MEVHMTFENRLPVCAYKRLTRSAYWRAIDQKQCGLTFSRHFGKFKTWIVPTTLSLLSLFIRINFSSYKFFSAFRIETRLSLFTRLFNSQNG